jgi:hypothetical protein
MNHLTNLELAEQHAQHADIANYNTPGMAISYADMHARLASAEALTRIATALERLVQFTQDLDLHNLDEALAGLG